MDQPRFSEHDLPIVKVLTCMMFFMFAMTTDAVGSIIPALIEEFSLSLSAASAFHYMPMIAIAAGGLGLGFLADRLGRKAAIVLGLLLYGCGSLLFIAGNGFGFFLTLLGISGIGISVFKVGALALVGDVTRDAGEHTRFMNLIEGFFAVGAIVGPAIVTTLIASGITWKYLYAAAAAICALLIVAALGVRYPAVPRAAATPVSLAATMTMMRDRYALGFSSLIALYVAVEVAIYVWMPTFLEGYDGSWPWLASYALTLFFTLRAVGRFLGVWLLRRLRWDTVLVVLAVAILGCFAGSLVGGRTLGVWLLPLSGLFMSVIYPTVNSKGISCFARDEHGVIAGVILFFTAAAAALGPLAMAAVSDLFGDIRYGFMLATAFAALLCGGLLWNRIAAPARSRLAEA